MVRSAIALNAAHEASRKLIVQDADVDAVARDAHLRKRLDSSPRQLAEHFTFERRFCIAETSSVGALQATMFRVQQEFTQQTWPIGRRCCQTDLISVH